MSKTMINRNRHFIKHLAGTMRFSSSLSSSQVPSLTTTTRNPHQFYTSLFCTLIHLFLRCRRLSSAAAAFSAMRDFKYTPELATWNSLLHHFNSAGLIHQVMVIYQEMIFSGVGLNVATKNIVVHSLSKVGEFDRALDLLRDNNDYEFMSDGVTYNTVIWGFCKYGHVEIGARFGVGDDQRGVDCDSFTCNILTKGFCEK
ncbi:hypothetical protein MIMGU_mgv1a0181002mg, partial [Erythranthe guttata]